MLGTKCSHGVSQNLDFFGWVKCKWLCKDSESKGGGITSVTIFTRVLKNVPIASEKMCKWLGETKRDVPLNSTLYPPHPPTHLSPRQTWLFWILVFWSSVHAVQFLISLFSSTAISLKSFQICQDRTSKLYCHWSLSWGIGQNPSLIHPAETPFLAWVSRFLSPVHFCTCLDEGNVFNTWI